MRTPEGAEAPRETPCLATAPSLFFSDDDGWPAFTRTKASVGLQRDPLAELRSPGLRVRDDEAEGARHAAAGLVVQKWYSVLLCVEEEHLSVWEAVAAHHTLY